MPFRLNDSRAKIQFVTSAETPYLVYQACLVTGLPSNTAYLQRAVAEALARDLDMSLADLIADLPPLQGSATYLHYKTGKPVPVSTQTVEELR